MTTNNIDPRKLLKFAHQPSIRLLLKDEYVGGRLHLKDMQSLTEYIYTSLGDRTVTIYEVMSCYGAWLAECSKLEIS